MTLLKHSTYPTRKRARVRISCGSEVPFLMREMRRGGAATKRLSDHTHICCLFLLLLFLLCVPDSRARCRYCHDARPSHDDLIRGEAVTPTATDRRARATLHSIVRQFGVWPPLKLKLSRRGENFLLRMPCPPVTQERDRNNSALCEHLSGQTMTTFCMTCDLVA